MFHYSFLITNIDIYISTQKKLVVLQSLGSSKIIITIAFTVNSSNFVLFTESAQLHEKHTHTHTSTQMANKSL